MNPSPRGTFGTCISKLSLLPKASRAGSWILGENHPVATIVVRLRTLVYVALIRRWDERTPCSFASVRAGDGLRKHRNACPVCCFAGVHRAAHEKESTTKAR